MMFSSDKNKLLPFAKAKSKLLLLQSGVYLYSEIESSELENAFEATYIIETDFIASGLDPDTLKNQSTHLITHSEWVELCAINHPIITLQ